MVMSLVLLGAPVAVVAFGLGYWLGWRRGWAACALPLFKPLAALDEAMMPRPGVPLPPRDETATNSGKTPTTAARP